MLKNNKNLDKSFWHFSQAKDVLIRDKIILFILFIFGIASVLNFGKWWFKEEHINSKWIFGLISLFIWYNIARAIVNWYTTLNVKKVKTPTVPKELSVAIFTTSYKGEPLEMIRKTLEACSKITYPHKTYLLDNTEDSAFKKAAQEFGAIWLELVGIPGAKAGKVNKAISLTKEEFILILDPDHIPYPNFFDNTLGFFSDPSVGFVQVSQGYYNQNRSFTAKAAAGQSYSYYGATQMGFNGLGCPIAIGANCTFRRSALNSIGGHVEGLAEDLQTSLKLHAEGWKSVYNPVIVNRGLVPEDFDSFCKQQLKWTIGAFEVLFYDWPKVFNRLNFKMNMTYLSIATYYFSGIISLLFCLLPFLFIFSGYMPLNMRIDEFAANGIWILLTSTTFYFYSQKWMCYPKGERGIQWGAMALKFATWPVYLWGFALSLVNAKIPYIPTSKKGTQQFSPFTRPLQIFILFFIISMLFAFINRRYLTLPGDLIFTSDGFIVMSAFAIVTFLMSIISILIAIPRKRKHKNNPWDEIIIDNINKNK